MVWSLLHNLFVRGLSVPSLFLSRALRVFSLVRYPRLTGMTIVVEQMEGIFGFGSRGSISTYPRPHFPLLAAASRRAEFDITLMVEMLSMDGHFYAETRGNWLTDWYSIKEDVAVGGGILSCQIAVDVRIASFSAAMDFGSILLPTGGSCGWFLGSTFQPIGSVCSCKSACL
ncbi:hypothetical protein U1Q18_005314 [Sarracenia purpurea var. burkii]